MSADTTLRELEATVQRFCEAREWDRFHSTEAAELLAHFRFRSNDEIKSMLCDQHSRAANRTRNLIVGLHNTVKAATTVRRCLFLFVALTLTGPLVAQAQQGSTVETIAHEYKDLVGLVIAKSPADGSIHGGTAFLTKWDGFALTAAHIVSDRKSSVFVKFPLCDAVQAKVGEYNERDDVAVLRFDFGLCSFSYMDFSGHPTPHQSQMGFEFAKYGTLHEGQQIVVISFPRPDVLGADTATVTTGIVSAVRKEGIQFQAPVSPGSSGAPILNMAGQVIGMVRGTLLGDQQGLNFAVPADTLRLHLCLGLVFEDVIATDQGVDCLVPKSFLGPARRNHGRKGG